MKDDVKTRGYRDLAAVEQCYEDTDPSLEDAEFDESCRRCERHVLARIGETSAGDHPFRHLFVAQILPDDVYADAHRYMLACKHGDKVIDREQDNPSFVNKRVNLVGDDHPTTRLIRQVFSSKAVMAAIAGRFYAQVTDDLIDGLAIHKEFEYFFTEAGRFQNIHVDIPPKLLSFVFYMPEQPVAPEAERQNATILYNRDLEPEYGARYRANSVCVFAPHFYSYHGFSSTIDRDVLVMFYVHDAEMKAWRLSRRDAVDEPPYDGIKDAIERKLRLYPMIEYGEGDARIVAERAACLINAPMGRVMRRG